MSNQKSKITYSDSGVDIDKANDLIDEIKPMIKQTLTAGVLSNIGGFGGLFELNSEDYERPVLVSGTDGVGTKVKLAQQLDILEGVGVDLDKSFRWMKKSADQGFPNALYHLGIAFNEGLGCKQSELEAIEWWRKAAEVGSREAVISLRLKALGNGHGLPPEYLNVEKKAPYWN